MAWSTSRRTDDDPLAELLRAQSVTGSGAQPGHVQTGLHAGAMAVEADSLAADTASAATG